jgi:CheY-like chemotaxis protein
LHQSDSGGENTGSTFRAADMSSGYPRRTILLVEDEALIREVAYEVLSRAGYRVLKAGNANEALQVVREHAGGVQLLLTDVVLPDRNGCDLALELAALCDGVKSIFVSGYPENSITRMGLRQPGWSYLPKPFSGIQHYKEGEQSSNKVFVGQDLFDLCIREVTK